MNNWKGASIFAAFFFKYFIYLFVREREKALAGERQAEEEAGFPLRKEPDGELDPRTLGS